MLRQGLPSHGLNPPTRRVALPDLRLPQPEAFCIEPGGARLSQMPRSPRESKLPVSTTPGPSCKLSEPVKQRSTLPTNTAPGDSQLSVKEEMLQAEIS